MTGKRNGYISWDEYFMGVAKLSGMRSKDPNSQVGACIVSQDNKILSMGYNGFPMGCSDDEFPWAREGEELDTKYFYVTHSELNAILNYRGGSLEGAKLYVSLFPCNECAKAIIQAGIRTVVYECDKYADSPAVKASKRMLDATKYFYVTHSELNAILNYRGGSLEGAKLYVSLFPCNECAKAIIQAGIRTVVYECDKYADSPAVKASKRMLDAAGVRYYQYNKTGRKIEIEV